MSCTPKSPKCGIPLDAAIVPHLVIDRRVRWRSNRSSGWSKAASLWSFSGRSADHHGLDESVRRRGIVAARTSATEIPIDIEGPARSYFGRLAGIYPRKLFPRIRIAVQSPRSIAMPQLPSAKSRRRRSGELMRRVLLDMLVARGPGEPSSRRFWMPKKRSARAIVWSRTCGCRRSPMDLCCAWRLALRDSAAGSQRQARSSG